MAQVFGQRNLYEFQPFLTRTLFFKVLSMLKLSHLSILKALKVNHLLKMHLLSMKTYHLSSMLKVNLLKLFLCVMIPIVTLCEVNWVYQCALNIPAFCELKDRMSKEIDSGLLLVGPKGCGKSVSLITLLIF